MKLIELVNEPLDGIVIKVSTSQGLVGKLRKARVPARMLKEDLSSELREWCCGSFPYMEFSPDRTSARLTELKLFLFGFDPNIWEKPKIIYGPVPSQIEGLGKTGWTNELILNEGRGLRYFLIQNGYYFLK